METTGIDLIIKERKRQIQEENWTLDHDKKYQNDELFNAAASYSALPERRNLNGDEIPSAWPWAANSWKPTPENRIRELEKAGALFMAHQDATGYDCAKEIKSCADRIDRLLLDLKSTTVSNNFLNVDPKPITWKQLKDFVNSIPDAKLDDTAYLLFQDDSQGKPLLEPFFMGQDIYAHIDDTDDVGRLDELQDAHGNAFDLADYVVVTPKGTPFLWAE